MSCSRPRGTRRAETGLGCRGLPVCLAYIPARKHGKFPCTPRLFGPARPTCFHHAGKHRRKRRILRTSTRRCPARCQPFFSPAGFPASQNKKEGLVLETWDPETNAWNDVVSSHFALIDPPDRHDPSGTTTLALLRTGVADKACL